MNLKIISFAVPHHIDPIDTLRASRVFPKEFWACSKKKDTKSPIEKKLQDNNMQPIF